MEASEPPVTVGWPRYSRRLLPTYRFLPGLTPHPRHNPLGHSFGQPESLPRPWGTRLKHDPAQLVDIQRTRFSEWLTVRIAVSPS